MSNTIPFDFQGSSVRVVMIDNEPWFVASDVARLLGYANPQEAVRVHCRGVSETLIPSAQGHQNTKIIPERDVYRLITRSKLPAAERFEDWLFGEVLPSIRKTGSYVAPTQPDPSHPAALLVRLNEAEQREREATQRAETAETKIRANAPIVAAFNLIANAEGLINLQAAAKALKMAPREFISRLERGFLYRRRGTLLPHERFIRAGLFVVKLVVVSGKARSWPYITPKGLTHLGLRLNAHLSA